MKNNELISKNDYQKNDNLNNLLIMLVLFVIASFCTYYGWRHLVGMVSDEFVSYQVMLPKIVAYFLPIIYFIVLFRNLYFKRFSKGGVIGFLITTTIILGGVIFGLIHNYEYYLSNFINSYIDSFTPIDVCLIVFVLLFSNLVLLIKTIQKKFNSEYRDPLNPGVFNVYTFKRFFFVLIILPFISFLFGDALMGILNYSYFVLYPIEYTLIILTMLMPFVTLCFYLNLNLKKKWTVVSYCVICLIDLLVFSGYLVMYYIVPNYTLCEITEHLFFLSFAGSILLHSAILLLLVLMSVINAFVQLVSFRKLNK